MANQFYVQFFALFAAVEELSSEDYSISAGKQVESDPNSISNSAAPIKTRSKVICEKRHQL